MQSMRGQGASADGWRTIVGIDEAGYGPVLGPLVVSAVAFELHSPETDLWEMLRGTVGTNLGRRDPKDPDTPLLVADSKKVYRPGLGLARLERSVLAFARQIHNEKTFTDLELIELLSARSCDLSGLPWYEGKPTPLPIEANPGDVDASARRLSDTMARKGLRLAAMRSFVVTAREFNAKVSEGRNKAELLAGLVGELLRFCARATQFRNANIVVDRLGGRRYYEGLLASCFDGLTISELEQRPDASVYSLGVGGDSLARISFFCRAESHCMATALASMVSKYLRELLMRRLNAYFVCRVAGLRPTSGYPTDAARFLADTEAFRHTEGIPNALLVRSR